MLHQPIFLKLHDTSGFLAKSKSGSNTTEVHERFLTIIPLHSITFFTPLNSSGTQKMHFFFMQADFRNFGY